LAVCAYNFQFSGHFRESANEIYVTKLIEKSARREELLEEME